MNTFNITVTDWEFLLGDTFLIHMAFTGTNKDSFYVGEQHDIVVTVKDSTATTGSKKANLTLYTD